MKLDDADKRILDGAEGPAFQRAMEMLVGLGKIYGAEKLVPIRSAHVAGLSLRSHGIAGMEWIEETAAAGARVKVPCTTNVIGVDRSRDLGLPKEWSEHQLRIERAYEKAGCYGTSSCTPYFFGFVPQFREHIAWAESSAVVFTNSALGARDNREGGPSAFAAALIGKTPYYGFHLEENRRASMKFRVTVPLRDIADIGALGAYVGKIIGTKNPAFDGLHPLSMEEHCSLGAALASSGGVALYHVMGQTPDALTLGNAVLAPDCVDVELGAKELQAGYEQLTSTTNSNVDYVAIGCPHLTLNQVADIAAYIQNKKVHATVTCWIHVNAAVKGMARQLGYMDIIEKTGAILTQDVCTILSIPEVLGLTSLATNSAKMAFYAPGSNTLPAWFGSMKHCIDAAVSGIWRG